MRHHLIPLLLLASACSAPRDHAEMRVDLEHAQELVAKRELANAAKLLERSLGPDAGHAADRGAELQRFHAAVLLVRTHVSAAFGAPFLPSARTPTGAAWNLDAKEPAPAPSPVAHCVAALRWVERARRWYVDIRAADGADREDLLPAALDGVTPRDALAYVQLAALACHARLRFEDRVEEILAGMDVLGELDRCDALLASTRVEDGLRPWIYYGVFEHWAPSDEPRAFKFAVRALETAAQARTFGAREQERLAHWIQHDSRFAFRCPTCETLADPVLFSCSVCRRPTLEFEPGPRETAK